MRVINASAGMKANEDIVIVLRISSIGIEDEGASAVRDLRD
jgi:hypothetical protein